MPAHPSIEDNHPCALLSQKAFDFRDRDARLPPNGNRADFADLLTQRRTVNGCKPRRLATSPERSRRVFSVLITGIDHQIYANLSTVNNPVGSIPSFQYTDNMGLVNVAAVHYSPRECLRKC